jgi:hypothetical protein
LLLLVDGSSEVNFWSFSSSFRAVSITPVSRWFSLVPPPSPLRPSWLTRILDPFHRPELSAPPLLFQMPRFFTGDELGNLKSFHYAPSSTAEPNVTVTTLHDGSGKGKERAVQNLAIHTSGDSPIVRSLTHSLPRSLTASWSKASSRARRRVHFCLQSTCARSGHDTRVDRTSAKTRPKIRRSSRIIRVRRYLLLFFSVTTQPGVPTLVPPFKGRILMHFERRPPPHPVGQRHGRRAAVANGRLAHASVRMAPRARWNLVLLRRRRGRALGLRRRDRLCSVGTATVACDHHKTVRRSRTPQEAQTQHRAAPPRRTVASEKCMCVWQQTGYIKYAYARAHGELL